MKEEKSKFAGYPQVADASMKMTHTDSEGYANPKKKFQKKVLKKKLKRVTRERDLFRKEAEELRQKMGAFENSDAQQEEKKQEQKRTEQSNKKKSFSFKNVVPWIIKGIRAVTGLINAVVSAFTVFSTGKSKRRAMA